MAAIVDHSADNYHGQPPLQVSDYLPFEEEQLDLVLSQVLVSRPLVQTNCQVAAASSPSDNGCWSVEGKRMKVGAAKRIGFRCKTEIENLPDGYRWRKYGKKPVKNSPNPRNYYKCCVEGCGVKKRVERDREDPAYVLTTYEGVHNHVCQPSSHMPPHDDRFILWNGNSSNPSSSPSPTGIRVHGYADPSSSGTYMYPTAWDLDVQTPYI